MADSPFSPPVRAAADRALHALDAGDTATAATSLVEVAQRGTDKDAYMAAEIVVAARDMHR